ncbi:MAG: ABC transporter permease [Deltaproteobacteria bacterium]|nr:ABC transporter permease [Deltaproteobacteria bacterium]
MGERQITGHPSRQPQAALTFGQFFGSNFHIRGAEHLIPIRYNLRSLTERAANAGMTAFSVALVAMVLLLLSGFVAGAAHTMAAAANGNNWIVLEKAVTNESGGMTHEMYEIVRALPEIQNDTAGRPLISGELVLGFDPTPDASVATNATLRGVTPAAFEVHRGLHFVSGRAPRRGQGEIVVGQRLAARFPNLSLGRTFRFGHHDWTVIGVFSDGGSARESEVWMDRDDLINDARVNAGQVGYNSAHVVLKPATSEQFEHALASDTRLRVHAMAEREFYVMQANFTDQIRDLGLVVAIVLSIGAVFGSMNTMYTAVARRSREVGVLRVLGFGQGSVLTSFIAEGVILGFAGGVARVVLGVLVASATGLTSRLMHVGTVLFSFRLTPTAVGVGIGAAMLIGMLGGLMPAWRASRLDIVSALRE